MTKKKGSIEEEFSRELSLESCTLFSDYLEEQGRSPSYVELLRKFIEWPKYFNEETQLIFWQILNKVKTIKGFCRQTEFFIDTYFPCPHPSSVIPWSLYTGQPEAWMDRKGQHRNHCYYCVADLQTDVVLHEMFSVNKKEGKTVQEIYEPYTAEFINRRLSYEHPISLDSIDCLGDIDKSIITPVMQFNIHKIGWMTRRYAPTANQDSRVYLWKSKNQAMFEIQRLLPQSELIEEEGKSLGECAHQHNISEFCIVRADMDECK